MGWGDWDFGSDEPRRGKAESQVEVQVYYVHQTAAALCVTTDLDAGEDIWLPKEAIAFTRVGTTVTLWAPEKLLLDKGLI